MKIAVSSCLLGHNVRFDGSNKRNDRIINMLKNHEIIPICPEQYSGFSIPHDPLEIKDGKVYTINGIDVSDILINGSNDLLNRITDCDFVILKSKSPTCGYMKIYDGSFTDTLIDGNGIFAQMCVNKKIKIFTENDLDLLEEILLDK